MPSSTPALRRFLRKIVSSRAVPAKGAAGIAIGSLGAIAGQLVLTKFVSNTVSVDDFGVFQMVLAIAWLLQTSCFGPLAIATLRLASEAQEQGWLRTLVRSAFVLALPGVVIALLMQGLLMNAGVALVLLAQTWVQIAALVVAWGLGRTSLGSCVAFLCGALAVVCTVQAAMLARHGGFARTGRGRASLSRSPLREILALSLPSMAWAPTSYITDFADRWALVRFATLADVGTYGVLVVLTSRAMTALSTVIDRIYTPRIYAAAAGADDGERTIEAARLLTRSCAAVLVAFVPLAAAYYFAPRLLIAAVSSSAYAGGAADLWLLGLAAAVWNLGQRLTLYGYIFKRIWIYLPAKIVPALVLVALLFLWTPTRGIHGVALSLIAAHSLQLVMVVATNLVFSRYRRVRLQRSRSLAA